jgi:peptidoglycan/LPS O-acetylase OafA/YrhL
MGALRLFLALVVVGGHVRLNVLEPAGIPMSWATTFGFNAGYALMHFYVISGFLISTALAGKYPPDLTGTLAFWRGRFVRIFSLYWPMAAICLLVVPAAQRGFAAASPLERLSDVAILGLDWRALAATAWPAPPPWTATIVSIEPSWSLGAELAFYLAAPWLLRSPGAAIAAAALSVGTRAVLVYAYGPGNTWTYLFWPSILVFFMLGHFARVAAERLELLREPRVGLALLALALAATALRPPTVWDTARFWLIFLAFAAALPGVFLATRKSRLHAWLADLSYPVYLTHSLVLTLFLTYSGAAIVAPLGLSPAYAGAALFAGVSAATLCAAWLAHHALERPIGALLRRLTARTARAGTRASPS